LTESGVRGVVHSDSSALVQRLNQEAAKSLSAGKRAGVAVDRGAALAWITSNPAWALGVESQTGSLEPGKMADVVVWSGDPLSVYTLVDRVYVDGLQLYDRSAAAPRPSDFELGQGAELPSRVVEPRRAPKDAGAGAPTGNSSAPAIGSVPAAAPAGIAPSGNAPANGSPPPAAPGGNAPAGPALSTPPVTPPPIEKPSPSAPSSPPPNSPPPAHRGVKGVRS